ncbi:hypothetical protein KL909_003241 [Ogataea angusta]|uniref:GP-PDE domain-containing protein n=1 Tax=Pichia angusta TaxID=870730 RepID=A0AAN6DD36_PICAN|nr:uncharacterized protein KL928_004264 [Ogataea angusta]KAG7816800.1 hypothetical protein KL928_004264 [Ogataea angusta]KAG7823218.1 hypothetical protein KL909_003241 [Ogataea angusta]KAG7857460.1 hypothetical protein KL939_003348 [Ogataea angusta]
MRAPDLACRANRRLKKTCPENTILAFEEAVKNGCSVIETDLHISSDGEVVICHDIDTNRVFGQDYVVTKTPYKGILSELRTLRAPHLPIPTLKQVLEWAVKTNESRSEPIKLMLDIKADNDPKRIVDLILENLEAVGGVEYWKDKIIYGLWGAAYYDERIAQFEVLNISVDVLTSIKVASQIKEKGGRLDCVSVIVVANGLAYMVEEILDFCEREKVRLWFWTVNSKEDLELALSKYGERKIDGQPLLEGVVTDDPATLLSPAKPALTFGYQVRLFLKTRVYLFILFLYRRNIGLRPLLTVLRKVGFL